MTVKIAQEAAPLDKSHWRWSVWLDAPSNELDKIRAVVWKLHPSFSPSEISVDSRKNNFRLESSGWGEFEIQAEIHHFKGQVKSLRRWLRFEREVSPRKKFRPGSIQVESVLPNRERQPAVFLSYSSSGRKLAGILTEILTQQHDFTVFVDVNIPPGEDLSRWIHEKISESDAVVLLLSDVTAVSPSYTGYEIGFAQSSGTPIILVNTAGTAIPRVLAESEAISIRGGVTELDASELDPQHIAQGIKEIVSRI